MWSIAKALQIPLDARISELRDLPYTLSFVVRKNLQVDNLSELPKEKRPPEKMLWYGKQEELDEWLDAVFNTKRQNTVEFDISEDDIG